MFKFTETEKTAVEICWNRKELLFKQYQIHWNRKEAFWNSFKHELILS